MIDEIRAFDPGLEIVVVDDGSVDRTSEVAAGTARTCSGCRSTSGSAAPSRPASATPSRTASSSRCGSTATASTILPSFRPCSSRCSPGEADIAVGSRFAGADGYRSTRSRRVGIRILARTVSLLVRQRVTDPTSGFQALNRRGIALFAADYPHDFPEVEATVMVARHRLRLAEVPVSMRERLAGESSIGALHAVYYMAKVLLALFVGLFKRPLVPPAMQ